MTKNKTVSMWLPWLVLLILLAVAVVLWKPLFVLITSAETTQLQTEVEHLGVLAPVAFLALSIIQIVGAPIPGYPVQFLGGVLFGPFWGSVYGVMGLTAGGFLAAWLSRTLGRPFIEKQVTSETLTKYERLAKLETLWVWVIILLIPLGDVPYFIAGLSRVKLSTLVLAILLSRGPFTCLIAWAGATSVEAPSWLFGALMAIILAVIVIGYLLRNWLNLLMDKHVLPRLE
jgi:uncharacterized membrane protein YdjX (TVP38/TMEM64 family)